MIHYAAETFTPGERDVLRRYVTNLHLPVFALVNLPEVVKGALFARYSRSHKTLRRLLLDEFVDDLDISGDESIDATAGVARAEQLYQRVFVEYGDDSVAQLGAVHLACEQASNVLTKVLERGRLMSYLEQSTRYLAYDERVHGRYRYHRPPGVTNSPAGTRYVGDIDTMFDAYGALVRRLGAWLAEHRGAKASHGSAGSAAASGVPAGGDLARRRALRAQAFDAARGLLPAASLSNVGIFGSGQAYEALLLRMRSHPLPEARSYAALMLTELRKVIPSFLRRVDQAERGVVWSAYLEANRTAMDDVARELFGDETPQPVPEVVLSDWDPAGEDKMLTAMLFPHTDLPESQIASRVAQMTEAQRLDLVRRYVGERSNRRHRPGRALERIDYRFDVLADYGSFRDLQRHRLLTIEWQPLTPHHGYVVPALVEAAGGGDAYDDVMELSADLYGALDEVAGPLEASYAVAMAYRVRYSMQFNAREAMHLIELRSQPQGHQDYRRIVATMYHHIAETAGHRAVAAMLSHVDLSEGTLGRLSAEQDTVRRRSAVPASSHPASANTPSPPAAARTTTD
ncbi:FAD-dependent thymidylate synthase [Candidatus Poriferisodalis sp.]|uniref:FAD-dependent thymidylate synthase n=1 Tax=Candidatus Poriferisodalis sp. TaxID=3101277 RepID=UPI003B023C56